MQNKKLSQIKKYLPIFLLIYVSIFNVEWGQSQIINHDKFENNNSLTIVLSRNTTILFEQSQTEYQAIRIEVKIMDMQLDNYFPESAFLYYKHYDDLIYERTSLIQGANSIWYADIPEQKVTYPCVHFYVSATDGYQSITQPSLDPELNPFVIPVGDNSPPNIEHKVVPYAFINTEVNIEAEIMDTTEFVESAFLYYRNPTDTTFKKVEMDLLNDDKYQAIIPGDDITLAGIEYYIQGTDNYKINAYKGRDISPMVIPVEDFVLANEVVKPNPFTPNNDGYNDFVFFNFPELAFGEGRIDIFNFRGRKVRELYDKYRWYGYDDSGQQLPIGTYLYIVTINGDIKTNGTITLIR